MSDEEAALQVTIQKCKEATLRADIMTEHHAIADVICGARLAS